MKAVRQQTDPPKSKKKKYSEEQLLVWAAHASPVNPTEYGPLIRGKLNENEKLVAAYEKWMAENRPNK